MRLKNYLNEDIKSIMDEIINDCKPFINDWLKTDQKNFLYSGRKIDMDFFKRKVRKNRRPLDTDIEIHHMMDNKFYEAFGIKARSQSIFCHSIPSTFYGTPFYIFPVGKYEIIWSNKILDLFGILPNKSDTSYYNKELERFKNFDVKKFYKKGNLRDALKHPGEKMIHCDEYYGINHYLITLKDIKNFIGK